MCILVSLTTFIVGTFWMLISVTDDISVALLKVTPEKSKWELTHRIYEFIQLYTEAKQLSLLYLRISVLFNIY